MQSKRDMGLFTRLRVMVNDILIVGDEAGCVPVSKDMGTAMAISIDKNVVLNPSGSLADVTALSEGRFLLTTSSVLTQQQYPSYYYNPITQTSSIAGTIYNSAGALDGGSLQMASTSSTWYYGYPYYYNSPKFASVSDASSDVLADGRVASAYVETSAPSFNGNNAVSQTRWISIAVRDQNGIGNSFTVATETSNDSVSNPEVAALTNGTLVVVWQAANAVNARIVDSDGLPVTQTFQLSNAVSLGRFGANVEALADGNFVVSWHSSEAGDLDAHARIFDANGNAVTPDLILNASDNGNQSNVRIAELPNGGFATAWVADSGSAGTYLRFFDSLGKPGSKVIKVSDTAFPDLAIGSVEDGRVMVAWSQELSPANSNDIVAQVFNPDGTAEDLIVVNSNRLGYQSAPTIVTIGDNTFKVVWQGNGINAATVTLPDYAPALAVTAAAKVSGGNGNAIADEAGDVITYTVKVTNTGTVTLGGVSLSDGETGLFKETGLILAPSEVKTFTGTYVLKQSDINLAGGGDGVLNLIATVDSNLTEAVTDSIDVAIVTSPKLNVKSVVADVSGANAIADVAGEVVTFKTTVVNSGNVTLTGITLTDSLSGIAEKVLPLAPGARRDIESTYVITQADIDNRGGGDAKLEFDVRVETAQTGAQSAAGSIALGYDPKLLITSALREITYAPDASAGNLVADEIGDILIYDYAIKNTGNVTLTNLSLIDSLTGVSIAGETLTPGEELVFADRRYVLSATDFETNGNGDADFDNLLIAVSDQTGTVTQESDPVKLVTYTLEGDDASNQLRGGSGADSINGKAGHDTINGGAGRDDLYGELGNDTLIGGSGADKLYGDIGNDVLRADDGNDLLDGGVGNDQLYGGAGNDALRGGDGSDQMFGAAGNDVITGGLGRDVLSGGAGADRFVYEARGDFGDAIVNFDKSDVFAFKASEFRMKKGFLDASRFQSRADNKAQDFNDRFIYRTTDDTLWYDADGTGSQVAFKVADLSNDFKLLAADILIV